MSCNYPIPVMMTLIQNNQSIPQLLSNWKDCIFITKILHICVAGHGLNPLSHISGQLPLQNQQQSSDLIPTTGAFILTLIGKWNDIAKYNYSGLKYTVTYLHDHNQNNQSAFDALQEMGRHLGACFTHPVAQQMISQTNGQLSYGQVDITFGLVTNINRTQNNHPTTIINPYYRTQHILSNWDPSCRQTPSVGWLCLFFDHSSNRYLYHLPIVNLSQHKQFMITYNPRDLPIAELAAYNALTNKWQNEKCDKRLSLRIPKPNELNPYTYLDAWNPVIQPFKDAEAKAAREKQRQQEEQQNQLIKSKSIQQFEEWKRLLLLQLQNDMYNNLYGTNISDYGINNVHNNNTKNNNNSFNTSTTTMNQTLFISSLLNKNTNIVDVSDNDNNSNNNNTNILPSSFQHTLFNEYYYKQYIKSQLDDLTIMNHLQYYKYLSSSSYGTTYRPRPHIALPSSSLSPSSSTTNTSSCSSSTTTSSSTIDTLIELATSLPPPLATTTTTSNDESIELATSLPPPPLPKTTALVTYTNNDATNSVKFTMMGDMDRNNIRNANNTNQLAITNSQRLILLQEQYNNILDQKHTLTIQYDDLINKYNTTLQTNETYNKQIRTLQQQLQSKDNQLETKEAIHQQQLESKDIFYQQQIIELTQSKDKQLESKDKQLESRDQQIALLMQMLAEANKK